MRWMIVAMGLCSTAQAQTNLVPNGDFESHTTLQAADCILSDASPWFGPGFSPDYFNADRPPLVFAPDTFTNCGVPENNRGYQDALSGIGYAGIHAFSKNQPNGREFVQIELSHPIQSGVRYEVAFFVSLADDFKYAVKTLGAYLSPSAITQTQYEIDDLNIVPQIVNDSILLDNKNTWQVVRDTFLSRIGGGERFLVIGNFNIDVTSDTVLLQTGLHDHSYYYIDDVSVIALDSVPSSVAEHERNRESFLVYPNPSNGQFTLSYQLDEFEVGSVKVFDVTGRQVFAQPLNNGTGMTVLSLRDLNDGTYLLRADVNGESRYSERLTILKE